MISSRPTGGLVLLILLTLFLLLSYTPLTLGDFNATCSDDDNCTLTREKCSNVTHTCVCGSGYTEKGSVCKADWGTACSAGDTCLDPHATCPTSNVCSCTPGYTANNNMCKANWGATCSAGDTCLDPHATCSASTVCSCTPGYTANNNMCKANWGATCSAGDTCLDPHATCSASTVCSCTPGYTANNNMCKANWGATCSAGDTCLDPHATCSASTVCSCTPGYTANNNMCKANWGATCSAGDTCLDPHATCSASTVCSCTPGYTANNNMCKANWGATCSAGDTCLDPHATCSASTVCSCTPGYTANNNMCKANWGATCSAGDTCLDPHATCSASTVCSCTPGYTANNNMCKANWGTTCSAGDTCLDPHATCSASTVCSCTPGYTANNNMCKANWGTTCSAGDTCLDPHATCSASTVCSCTPGYTANNNMCKANWGTTCSAGDTCLDPHATCSASTVCSCTPGYTANNNMCKANWGTTCSAGDTCLDPHATCSASTVCSCTPGYTANNNMCKANWGTTCSAGDTCLDPHATCSASTVCSCTPGYTANNNMCKANWGTTCSAGDTCLDPHATCSASTVCSCTPGYTANNNMCKANWGTTCSAGDTCLDPHATCSASTVCSCTPGYTANNNMCKANNGGSCGSNGDCYEVYAICSVNICRCANGYTDSNANESGGRCTADLGSVCTLNTDPKCTDLNAECSASCKCKISYYNSSNTCSTTSNLQVQKLTIRTVMETSLSVQWEKPAKYYDLTKYEISWKRVNITDVSNKIDVNKDATSANLNSSLISGAAYLITVTSFQNAEVNISVSIEQAMKPNKPSSIDNTSSKFDLVVDGKLTIAWIYSGITSGFSVQLIDGNLTKPFEVTTTYVNISASGLKNGYKYNVSIITKSEQYNSSSVWKTVDSDAFIDSIKTVVKVPDPPTMVQCSDIKDTSINLTWHHPLIPNGDILQYVVQTYRYLNETVPIMSNSTTSPSESLMVVGLDPGQYYKFRVFTRNELYQEQTGTWSPSPYCPTKAKMSEPPTNLSASGITSRSFTVSWNQPNNIYGELVGYVLKITNTEMNQCIVEEFTNCSTGCTGAFPNQTAISPTCGQNISYQSANRTELHTRTRIFTGFFTPDTMYKVSAVAVNQADMGHTAELNVTTLEEAPQMPFNVTVTDKQATSASVEWSINGPRPGKTNYTIIATGNRPADRKTYIAYGFSTISYTMLGLEAYWHYSVFVIASTMKGSNESYSVTFNTTVAPAGNVSDFNVRGGSGDDKSVTAVVSWSLPVILQRNGPISRFTVLQETMVNGTFVQMNSRNVTSVSDESNLYSTEFQVQREQLHRFIVFAFNGMDGAASSMNYYAAAADKPSSVGALAGGIAGGAAALILIVVIIVLWRRKSNKLKKARRLSDDATVSNMENLTKVRKQRPINLATFAEYVADHHRDSNLKFSEEYEDLKTLSPQHPHEAADMEENRLKNRFVNILPFDHSRVKLLPIDDVPGSDYINANFLPGFTKTREYIACQGPIPATIDDHWRLTWEQNVRVIVMLTQYKEENRVKCEPYMPLELKDPKQYGDLVVECLTYSSMNSFEYRTLKIKLGDKERTLKHFHFLSWRDYSANVQFDTMIDFIKKVRGFIQPPDLEGPMIVHCSAGVGRTGTYITIDHVIQHIDKYGTDSTVDIFNFVLKMRENRTTMVQTEQQYIFIHDCIKEYLDRFKTYENQAFSNEEENLYQNTETNQLYENFNLNSTQKTEL